MGISIRDQSIFSLDSVIETYGEMFKGLERHSPTDYDRIMDAVYRETHIGGGTHRHFDGTHTFSGSYGAIKSATGGVDTVDYIKAHVNELVTPEGIPLFTMNKASFDHLTMEISEALGGYVTAGQIRSLIRDFNSFNAGDLLSAGVGMAFTAYAFKSGSSKAISRTVAVNLCIGIFTANPVQIFVGLTGLGVGLFRGQIRSWELLTGAVALGASLAGFKIGREVLNLGKGGSLVMSVAIGIGATAVMEYLDTKKRASVREELGNSEYYLPVMTPGLLSRDLEIIGRRQPSLSVTI